MVLHGKLCGRVGRGRVLIQNAVSKKAAGVFYIQPILRPLFKRQKIRVLPPANSYKIYILILNLGAQVNL